MPTRPCQPQLGQVDGARVEALGGVEFEHAVGAQHVERADLGDHVLRDLAHDPVEPLLRLERLRHELAEPLQQYARAWGTDHASRILSNGIAAGRTPRPAGESARRVCFAYCLSRP